MSVGRRLLIGFGVLILVVAGFAGYQYLSTAEADMKYHQMETDPAKLSVTLNYSPRCQCCERWAKYLEAHDIDVTYEQISGQDMPRPAQFQGVESCHTAELNVNDGKEYVLEGHVPVAAIDKLVQESPSLLGLSVPGMPATSAGHNKPYTSGPVEVLQVEQDGDVETFQTVEGY